MRCIPAIVLALTALLASPVHAAKPQIQWDEAYDFATIKTFQWKSSSNSSLEQRNPFLHSRVVAAIEYELTGTGLTEVQSNPDVFVTYHTETEEKIRLQSNSVGYGFGGYGGPGWGRYGYGYGFAYGGPISTTTRVEEYEEGTLIVDIWSAASNQLIWRGTASRVFSEDLQKAEKQVVKIIKAMASQSKKLRERAAS
jgi:hypothetical protein